MRGGENYEAILVFGTGRRVEMVNVEPFRLQAFGHTLKHARFVRELGNHDIGLARLKLLNGEGPSRGRYRPSASG